jgi:hypothetical protein
MLPCSWFIAFDNKSPTYSFTRYAWLLSFFNILDHACTSCVVFANSFGKSFQSLFANSQRHMKKFSRSIFKIWNFLPRFQMLFLWLNKTPPEWNSPLSFQEGFNRYKLEIYWDANFWKYTNWKSYQFEIYQLKISKGGGVVLFLWANTLSPFGINRKKRRLCEPSLLSPPLVNKIWVKIYTNRRVVWSDGEG